MINIKGMYILIFSILAIIMVASPLPLLFGSNYIDINNNITDDVFLVYLEEKDEIVTVGAEEYIIGVLAAEMSPEAKPESLKATAVAIYTYALHKRNMRIEKGQEYDLISSKDADHNYLDTTEQVAMWQEEYSKNRKIFEDIVKSVKGVKITFGGKPILALCHSVSAGKTEAAAGILEGNHPYLQAIESTSDLLSPDYLSEVIYSPLDFADKALDLGITLVGEPESWLEGPERSSSGGVLEYTLNSHTVKGTDMQKAFGLFSINFDLEYINEKFVFTVRGIGHGIGMSRFGAEYMATQGSSYEQILEWYYPGTVIEK